MGLLSKVLSTISGNNDMKISEQLLFDKVIGFRSVVPGCGASTVLQNVAIALSEATKFNICVLDTNFLYPIQYPLLTSSDMKQKEKEPDILDFAGDMSQIVRNTSYSNIYIAQLEKRTVVDMLSGKDTETNITKLIANLKTYFDIILIDLSHELTNVNIHSAIKCNKIFHVADTSLKCLYYIKKSINTMVTLGVPLAKCNKVIVNKMLDNVDLAIESTLKEAGLEVLGGIPLSMDIAIFCASGSRIYGGMSKDKGVTEFNKVINKILENIVEKNPLNSSYINVAKELARITEENKKKNQKEEVIIEEAESEFGIEELPDEILDGETIYEEPVEDNTDISVNLTKGEDGE